MKLTSLTFYLAQPSRIFHQLRFKLWLKRNPDVPWISPKAVNFLDHNLNKNMEALEWGSGRSTVWYAKRVKKIVSIEHNNSWFESVRSKIKNLQVNNAEIKFIGLDHPEKDPTPAHYDQTPKYVAVVDNYKDETLDFVVIDGHYRLTCVKQVLPKLRKGALLLIDNTNWMPLENWGVPKDWELVHKSFNGVSETSIWKKPS